MCTQPWCSPYTLPSLLAHSVRLVNRCRHTGMSPQFMWGSLLWSSVENKWKGSLPTRASCRAAQNCHYSCEAGFVPTLAFTVLHALFSCYPFFLSAPDNRRSQLCVFCKGVVAVIQYLAFSGRRVTLCDIHVGSSH